MKTDKELLPIALVYDFDGTLGIIVELASAKDISLLSKSKLQEFGNTIPLFSGVKSWFPRINQYAKTQDIELKHYIISSGLEEMIFGCEVGNQFDKIFGCRIEIFQDNPMLIWPTQAINYTTKTQFLFRINKGIDNSWNNEIINQFIEPEERPIPFKQMIFLGDGDTDIPSMKMVRHQGGTFIGSFQSK